MELQIKPVLAEKPEAVQPFLCLEPNNALPYIDSSQSSHRRRFNEFRSERRCESDARTHRTPKSLARHNTRLPQYISHCLPAVAGSALEVRGSLARFNQFSLITNHSFPFPYGGVGRGCGVGRGLGVARGVALGVGVAVGVGVTVGVGVGVALGEGVGVGVGGAPPGNG
jgi:hypothetical protein